MANDHPWAKEPWEYEEADPLQGFIVNEEGDEITYPIVAINPKHLPRIVACVNACRNISQEVLERVAKGSGFGHILIDLMAQKGIEPEGYFKQQFPNDNEEPRDATD